jgi:hypothetical protein
VESNVSIASWNSSSTVTLTSGVTITVAIDYGLATEEKVLAYYVDSTHINITARGVDGTTAQTHGAGAFFIPVWSATEAQEAQNAVQLLKPVLTNTGGATTPAVIGVDATAAVGTAQVVAPIDHVHDLPSTSLATWLQGATVTASNLTVPAANVSGTLSAATVPAANLTGTLSTTQLANASNFWYPTAVTSGTVSSTTLTSFISQAGVTGFTNYLITFNANVLMGSGGAHNINASVGINAAAVGSVMTQYTVAGQTSSLSVTYIYSTTAGSTFTVNGMLSSASGAGATINAATLSIVGLA